MKRAKYAAELKLKAAKQIIEKGHSVAEVFSRLGVPESLLCILTRKLKGPDKLLMEDVKVLQA